MANLEQLKILEQGVEVWNKWREENPNIRPKLSELNGRGLNLSKANLSSTDLTWSDFKEANLKGVQLRESDLRGIVFREANLSEADLLRSDLTGADLSESKLIMANLSEVNLDWANLYKADLSRAQLRKAFLGDANLFGANLVGANLEGADLRGCSLAQIDLSTAVLTGAKLYGSARDDWHIKGVECDYIYWDINGKQRSPKDRDLAPGEFERLYASLPTIEYIFEKGMSPIDPLIMDRVVRAIREKQPEFDIKIDSINARGLAPSIKFTVQRKEHKEPALQEVQKAYDERIKRLEAEKDRLYNLLGQAIDKDSVKIITAGPGSTVATDVSSISITQHIHNALELQKAIADEPEESESFAKVAKKTAMDIIGEAIKDIAKGHVKEAAKQIIELGKDLGPIIVKRMAYAFFKNLC